MTKRIFGLLFIFTLLAHSAVAQSLEGSWRGPIKLPQGDLLFVLNLSATDGKLKATADSPDQNQFGMPVDTVMVDGDIIRFAIGQLKVRFQGTLITADSIAGDFVQSGATFPLGLRRAGSSQAGSEQVAVMSSDNEEAASKDSLALDAEGEENELDLTPSIQQEGSDRLAPVDTTIQVADTIIINKLKSLEPVLAQVLKNYQAAGYAVAVVNKQGILYSKGFGFRDFENGKEVTPNTLFAIGSVTKAFTAALLGQLADEDKLSLDSPVTQYMPKLKFANAELNRVITLRDMITHRTGLPRYDLSWYLFPSPSRENLLSRLQYMRPTTGVREQWQYNNFMYLAQGKLVEEISGRSWERNLEEVFFKPLDMRRSNASIAALAADADGSFGYTLLRDSVIKKMDYYNISGMGPAGSINSSVSELSNWVRLWLNTGQWAGKQLLSKDYVQQAISSQMVMAPGLPSNEHPDISFSSYGLGWMLHSYRGHYLVEHGGNIDGFSSNVAFFPKDGLGIIVLSNQNASPIPAVVRNLIADQVFDLSPYAWSKSAADRKAQNQEVQVKDMGQVSGTQMSHALADYAGVAEHPAFGKIDFYLKGDSLYAKLPNRSFLLKHYHYDVFEAQPLDKKTGRVDSTESATTKLNFQSGIDGSLDRVEIALEPSHKDAQVFKFSKSIDLEDVQFEDYVGTYVLSGMTITVYHKDGFLYLSVPGQPDYKSIAQGNHKFKPESLNGYLFSFEANEEGVISALYLVQPNGTFKATKN